MASETVIKSLEEADRRAVGEALSCGLPPQSSYLPRWRVSLVVPDVPSVVSAKNAVALA